jgi:proteasome lid subunit RPN8/RPN11
VVGEGPGPASVAIPASVVAAMVEHARADYPNEMCGIVSGSGLPAAGGEARRWFPARNAFASPLRYNIHPDDLLRIVTAIDDADEEVWAIVHSHVRSAARPSPTDIGLAVNWPDALYILVSLAADPPDVRAWRIAGEDVFEVRLEPPAAT